MTSIKIVNYSKKISDDTIKCYIESFITYLNDNNVNCKEIEILYDNSVKDIVDFSIFSPAKGESLLENVEFLMHISDLVSDNNKLALIGENIHTKYRWGDAIKQITIIKKLEEKNIWHEIAHLIGVEDHYKDDTKPSDFCKDNNCIMRYGILEGELCSEAIKEIRCYLGKSVK